MATSPASNEVLNSWKEIARYVDRGVRTVQRWEQDLALPVRRPRGKHRSAVLAIRSDLDKWLNECPVGQEHICTSMKVPQTHAIKLDANLLSESRQLRSEMARVREEFRDAVKTLQQTCESPLFSSL